MPTTIPQIPTEAPRAGRIVRARHMRYLFGAMRDASVVEAEAGQVLPTPYESPTVRELEIVGFGPAANDGILLTNDPDDVQGAPEVIEVLVPPTLNEAARGGVSYTYTSHILRTADGTESQYLWPSYVAGDLVICAYIGGTWRDLNIDGRQWVADA